MNTKLLYLEDMDNCSCVAKVAEVISEDGRAVVILDQTIYYPQGGGQPYDTGTITSEEKNLWLRKFAL
jgi:alanyl-tRNA synthetase